MSISKREALLLFIMGVMAILVVSITFVILPLQRNIETLELQKSQLETRKAVIDATLPLAPSLRNRQEEKLVVVNDELAKIEDPINAAEFERWILPITTKYDMRITSVSLSEPAISTPSGMIILVDEPSYKLKTLVEGYKGEATLPDSAPSSSAQLLKSVYTYSVETTYSRYSALLDEIRQWNNTFMVSSSSYNFSTSLATITIDAYMIHKIEPSSDKDYSGDYVAGGSNGNPDDSDDDWPAK
ncbi:MAG TPA: hypothetical protein DEA51_07345 [Erysipelotrichaceae bacterium]|nr:hypothetical protein [Erysipelotrichaceae bacterium]